ncbi:hypothetical protein CEXT_518481 [Caerostris extrusa]|uniref:Uncharacterized protein n=1 Tax=Caerostris extrusa TaxID=172846 RepID=A0AAV4TYX0_CAEEX|nr:hypothetical protein CEXT_518481 [Caerostris extrusa]
MGKKEDIDGPEKRSISLLPPTFQNRHLFPFRAQQSGVESEGGNQNGIRDVHLHGIRQFRGFFFYLPGKKESVDSIFLKRELHKEDCDCYISSKNYPGLPPS